MSILGTLRRITGPRAGLCAVLLVASSMGAAQDPSIKVTITGTRSVVYRFQDVKLKLTIENTGEEATAAIDRKDLLGERNFLCAEAAFTGSDRKGTWAEPVRAKAAGAIGSLLPGESFMTNVALRLPGELARKQTAVSLQWVGHGDALKGLRSDEIQISLRDGKHPIAEIATSMGEFTLELWDDKAPNHVANFIHLARKNFFDGLAFHRVYPNFIIQTGSPDGSSKGGPGYAIPFEQNDHKFKKGVVGMATVGEDRDSGGSQWFICVADVQALDGKYTAFARIGEGQDVVDKIGRVPSDKGKPSQTVKVRSVKVLTPEKYVLPAIQKTGDKKEPPKKPEGGSDEKSDQDGK